MQENFFRAFKTRGWSTERLFAHSVWALVRGTQRLFSVKYLFGEAKIAYNFLLLEEG